MKLSVGAVTASHLDPCSSVSSEVAVVSDEVGAVVNSVGVS